MIVKEEVKAMRSIGGMRLDEVVPPNTIVDLAKIDVEGAHYYLLFFPMH